MGIAPQPHFFMTDYQTILSFWFGDDATDLEIINRQSSLWWGKNEAVDREIRDRFAGLHKRLIGGELDAWKADDRGRLAMVILADQFPRNMYRDTPEAFASDALAVSLTLEGIDAGTDRRLRPVERVFFYMPLMHAESRALQDRAVTLYRDLAGEAEQRTTVLIPALTSWDRSRVAVPKYKPQIFPEAEPAPPVAEAIKGKRQVSGCKRQLQCRWRQHSPVYLQQQQLQPAVQV